MIHDYSAFLIINFSINTRVPDKVNDPLFAVILAQAKASREVPRTHLILDAPENGSKLLHVLDINALVDLAITF